MSEEKLQFSRGLLILGNLGLLAWIFLAFISVFFYNQLYGWLYLLFMAFMVYVILRRLGCSSCYLCKECTSGFGRLAAAFFGRGYVKRGSVGNRLGFIAFLYVMLLPIPAALMSISFGDSLSHVKVFVLTCLLAVSTYSLATWYNRLLAKKV